MGKNREVLKAITAFSQVSLTVLSPIAACLVIGAFLVSKGMPQYTLVILIILGAISGFYSMVKYILAITKSEEKTNNGAKK